MRSENKGVALSGDAARFSAPHEFDPCPCWELTTAPLGLPFTRQYLAMDSNPIRLIVIFQSKSTNMFCCRGHMDGYRRAFVDQIEYTGSSLEKPGVTYKGHN